MISDLEITLRLAMAALMGSLIGFERERRLWAAGIRTHMLVSVGASLLMIVSAYGFGHATTLPHVILDPSRVAAQVVSGIGFLGAGAILLRKEVVRGLTTAASIWAVAAIGLACGGGLYFAGVVSTAIILVILAGIKPLEDAYRARMQSVLVRVEADVGAPVEAELKKALGVRASQLRKVRVVAEADGLQLSARLVRVSPEVVDRGAARLRAQAGVRSVEIVRAAVERE